jgi:hypothetical protein
MKIKYFILLFLIFFVSLILFGCDPGSIGSSDYGTAQVRGYVMDATSKVGIADALVLTTPASDSTKTDTKGTFFILSYKLNSNPQDIIIITEKSGYKTGQTNITVQADQTTDVTVLMERK